MELLEASLNPSERVPEGTSRQISEENFDGLPEGTPVGVLNKTSGEIFGETLTGIPE